MSKFKYIAIVTVILLFVSCYKEADTICNININIQIKKNADAPNEKYSNVRAYLFYADTSLYKITSYENAIKGVMVNPIDNTSLNYEIKGVYHDKEEKLIIPNITNEWVTIVVCDTINKIYAQKINQVAAGLNDIYLQLDFKPYEFNDENSVVEDKTWVIKNDL